MSQMINRNGALLRICPKDPKRLEQSTNGGSSWMNKFPGSPTVGEFKDLTEYGGDILATTTKGIFKSTNNGNAWTKKSN